MYFYHALTNAPDDVHIETLCAFQKYLVFCIRTLYLSGVPFWETNEGARQEVFYAVMIASKVHQISSIFRDLRQMWAKDSFPTQSTNST